MKLKFPVNPPFRISQKYNENALNYESLGVPGLTFHGGMDIAVPTGTPVFAMANGFVSEEVHKFKANEFGDGFGNYVRLLCATDVSNIFFDQVYGHVLSVVGKVGDGVKQGQLIAHSDNNGRTTGPHLHIGIREMIEGGEGKAYRFFEGKQYAIVNFDNGVLGYVDPEPYFGEQEEEMLAVDIRYGQERSIIREAKWNIQHGAYAKRRAILNGIPWNDRLMKGFVYGYWDADTVFSPGLYALWTNFTKIEYQQRFKGRV